MTDHPATRRRLIRVLGVGAAGSLAGCQGTDVDGGRTPTDPRGGGTRTEPGDGEPTATETDDGDTPTRRTETAKLVPDDGDAGDGFASFVALSGDGATALVGAPFDEDPNGQGAGAAYVFELSGGEWRQRPKLAASDGSPADHFGWPVSLSADGRTALVGAWNAGAGDQRVVGSASAFGRSGGEWVRRATLLAADRDGFDQFAKSVALAADGATALLGAPTDEDPGGEGAGSAYDFERSGGEWSQRAKLTPADAGDAFGGSVALSSDGTTALLGAAHDEDPNGEDAGSAHVFGRSGGEWRRRATLAAADGSPGDAFGSEVALAGDGATALVAAPLWENSAGEWAGSAYVFEVSGGEWRQRATLSPVDAGTGFGSAVALSADGTTALVGADSADGNGAGAGAAYLFGRSDEGWSRRATLAASDGDADDEFGRTVALSADGATALVGSWDEDPNGRDAGAAYAFDV